MVKETWVRGRELSWREETREDLLEGGRSIGPDAFLSACDTRKAPGVTRALGCGGEFYSGRGVSLPAFPLEVQVQVVTRVPHALLRARQFSPEPTRTRSVSENAPTNVSGKDRLGYVHASLVCLPSVLAAASAPIGSNASAPSPFVGLALFGRGVRTGFFLGFLGLSGSLPLPSFGERGEGWREQNQHSF